MGPEPARKGTRREVAARIAEVIKCDWGVRISGQKRQLLADTLASHL